MQRLFEQEIPEIAEGVITIKAISREAKKHGYTIMLVDTDELEIAGALQGRPLPVVKCVTSEIRVPADWRPVAIEDSPGGVAAARAASVPVVVPRSLYFTDAAID